MGDSVDKFVVIMDAVTSIGVRCTPTVFTHPGKNELGMKQDETDIGGADVELVHGNV